MFLMSGRSFFAPFFMNVCNLYWLNIIRRLMATEIFLPLRTIKFHYDEKHQTEKFFFIFPLFSHQHFFPSAFFRTPFPSFNA